VTESIYGSGPCRNRSILGRSFSQCDLDGSSSTGYFRVSIDSDSLIPLLLKDVALMWGLTPQNQKLKIDDPVEK
jgi:hypothetical protein